MTTFIHLPHKKTTSIDWNSPLTKFLNSTFGRSFTDEISSSITQLNKIRNDIQHAQPSDGETLLPIYIEYLTQINSLELRLPMHAVTSGDDVKFSWTDAFDSRSEFVEQASLSFEKASILFSLASIYSYLGATSASSLDWKKAVLQFSNASGILEYISINFLHSPTNDMKVDTTKGLSKLMLAQAQECFLWNYMQSSSNIKHSLACKLAEGISSNYRSATEIIGKSKSKLECNEEIHFKSTYFHTFAMFNYAQSYMETTKVGFAIVANKLAKTSLLQSKKLISQTSKNKIEPGLIQLNDELEKEIQIKDTEWEKDNDLIYHQPLPEILNVPTIKSMEGAKAVSFEIQLKNANCKDLFEKIVPMEAHQSMSIYSEKQAEITRDWSERVQVADEQVKSAFEFSRLPESVIEVQNLLRTTNPIIEEEEREKEDEYPRVLAMAHEIEFSHDTDFDMCTHEVQEKRKIILKHLEDADSLFLKDDRNTLIKGLSTGPEISKLKDEVSVIRRNLLEAGNSDSKLNDLWQKFSVEINVLRNGASGVQKWLCESTKSEENTITEQVSLLDLDDSQSNFDEFEIKTAHHLIEVIYSLKKSLELLIEERNSTLKDLKNAMHSEDISSVLIKYRGASESELDKVFNEQLSKYDSYMSRLGNLIAAQDDKILELKDSLGKLLSLKIVSKKVEDRKKQRGTIKAKLARLVHAYETFKLCTKGAGEGKDFYSKLIEKTSYLVCRIGDVVNQRASFSDEMRLSVSSNPSGGFGGNTINAYNQYQYQATSLPPPSYSNTIYGNATNPPRSESISSTIGSAPPPLPSKPNYTGSEQNKPYSTPSVYSPGMYAEFGQNWKSS